MNRIILFLLLLSGGTLFSQNIFIEPDQNHPSSFAIFVDAVTYEKIDEAVKAYKHAVENDGLSVYLIAENWNKPDDIKEHILALYSKESPLEGVVFIGDIPIPMIRNAQHMTSAFKLDEDNFPIYRSSVPSDRFYDDFDLKFTYISQDTVDLLAHYYSLNSDSPQRIERNIYSARIKAPAKDESKYEMIKNYLLRAAEAKKSRHKLTNMFSYTGHGYYSESLPAWGDERISLQEQFPQLFRHGGRIKNLFHAMSNEMKDYVLTMLQKPELDIALFHAHGTVEEQLINAYPRASMIGQNVEAIKLFLRSKLREAQRRNRSVEDAKKYYQDAYDIPASWFEGAFSDSLTTADSLLAYSLDIYVEDIRQISPQPKFVMFDQCFNGSFHRPNYMAGEYVFGSGKVIVAEANSVNCLQDKWANEFLGLLNFGTRIGQWHKFVNLLESHLIGDPTFYFTHNTSVDVNRLLNFEQKNIAMWRELLKSDYPELRALSVYFLYKNLGKDFEKELLSIYRSDESVNVRLQTFKNLVELNSEGFEEILFETVLDSYEYIRRISARLIGQIGKDEYLPVLAKQALMDESVRVVFNGRGSLGVMNHSKAIEEINNFVNELPSITAREKMRDGLIRSMNYSSNWLNEELFPNIKNDTLSMRARLNAVRTFRNYNFHEGVPALVNIALDEKYPEIIRRNIVEALGWFNISYQRKIIIEMCDKLISSGVSDTIKDEAVRTKNRILAGLNNTMAP